MDKKFTNGAKRIFAAMVAVTLLTGAVPYTPIGDVLGNIAITAEARTYDGWSHVNCTDCSAGDIFEAGAELFNNTNSDIYLNFTDNSGLSEDLPSREGTIIGIRYKIVSKNGNTWNLQVARNTDSITTTPGGDTVFAYTGSEHSLVTSAGKAKSGKTLQYAVSTSNSTAPTSWTTNISSLKKSAQGTYYLWVKTDVSESYNAISPCVCKTIYITTDTTKIFGSGNGTSNSPYIINNENGWNFMCDALQNTTFSGFSGKYFRLDSNITVTKMAGTNAYEFKGNFNGNNKKLTFSCTASRNYTAPFSNVSGTESSHATISNLNVLTTINATDFKHIAGIVGEQTGYTDITDCHAEVHLNASIGTNEPSDLYPAGIISQVAGTLTVTGCTVTGDITTNGKYAGGFVGVTQGTTSIENCLSSVTINSSTNIVSSTYPDGNKDGTHGGFIAVQQSGTITIRGCAFNGKLLSSNGTIKWGGFIGWRNKTANIYDSIFAPSQVSNGMNEYSATFARNTVDTYNCYYTYPLNDGTNYRPGSANDTSNPDKWHNGKAPLTITAGQYVSFNKGSATNYNVSGITAYSHGMDYNGKFYIGEGDTLKLSHDARDEYYSFSHYTTTVGSVSGNTLTVGNANATVNAVYNENFYTATWKNYDNSTLTTSKVLKGNTPKYPSKDAPTRPMDNYHIYSFSGWDKELTAMTGNTTYTAQYSARDREWLVLWENYNGDILSISTGKYDDQHTYNGTETPTRTGDAQYSYEFTGWSDKTTNIYRPTNDYQELALCYIAQYRQVTNKYTVTWVDGDGNTTTQSVAYGTTPTAPQNPTKTGNAQYRYTFTGWDKEITAVTGNVTYTAQFTETTNTYTVTWVDGDGNTTTDSVAYGEIPVYSGTTPTKAETEFYTYTFSGWGEVTAVTGDVTYTAQFTETPKYMGGLTVCNGKDVYCNIPYMSGWNDTTTGTEQIYPSSMLTNLTGKKLYSLTFYSSDDVEIDVKGMQVYLAEVDFTTMPNGWIAIPDNAVKVFDSDSDYDFGSGANVITFDTPYTYNGGNLMVIIQNSADGTKNTDKYFYGVWGNTTGVSSHRYTANNYTYARAFLAKCTFGYPDTNQYTVTWKDTDGTVLETDTDLYAGTMPEYNGEKTVSYWTDGTDIYANDNLPAVKGDVTYTAAEYTVTWKDADGNILEIDTNVMPFTTPQFNGTVTVPKNHTLCWTNDANTYTSDNLPAVTSNVTYTAVFAKPLAVGTVFYPGELVNFGYQWFTYDGYDEVEEICYSIDDSCVSFFTMNEDTYYDYGLYWIVGNSNQGIYSFELEWEYVGTNIGIMVTGGDGTGAHPFTFEVVTAQPLENTAQLSADTIHVGETVTVQASATGGNGDYLYAVQYKKATDTKWTNVQSFDANGTITVAPMKAVPYQVRVTVKDEDGNESVKILDVNVVPVVTNLSTVSSTSVALGDTVTVNAAAKGGTGNYTYTVHYKKVSDTKWTSVQIDSANATIAVTPKKMTDYQIRVIAKDELGGQSEKLFEVSVGSAALLNTSTVDTTTVPLGQSVNVTASAQGGSGAYTYAVYYRKASDTKWTTIQAFGTNSTVTVTPMKKTNYQICVKAKDGKGDITEKIFDITVTNALLQNTSTLSADTVALGQDVTVNASATGGTAPYQYSVQYKRSIDTKWTTAQAYSANSTVVVTPKKKTAYDICVKAKDSKGNVEEKNFTVDVQ